MSGGCISGVFRVHGLDEATAISTQSRTMIARLAKRPASDCVKAKISRKTRGNRKLLQLRLLR
jgi:hypothetical protein